MAISLIDSQGTKAYIVDVPATPWADCTAAVTAIQSGDEIGCPQSLGNLEETRSMTEYKCLSSDESIKSLGAISRGNIEIGLLFDPADTAGQAALKAAFAANDQFVIGLELSDIPTAGTNGTMLWFQGGISAVSTGIEQDAAVTYTVTIEISSAITECPAA